MFAVYVGIEVITLGPLCLLSAYFPFFPASVANWEFHSFTRIWLKFSPGHLNYILSTNFTIYDKIKMVWFLQYSPKPFFLTEITWGWGLVNFLNLGKLGRWSRFHETCTVFYKMFFVFFYEKSLDILNSSKRLNNL